MLNQRILVLTHFSLYLSFIPFSEILKTQTVVLEDTFSFFYFVFSSPVLYSTEPYILGLTLTDILAVLSLFFKSRYTVKNSLPRIVPLGDS